MRKSVSSLRSPGETMFQEERYRLQHSGMSYDKTEICCKRYRDGKNRQVVKV